MPIGEQEVHPYLALGATPNTTRLILGSFPIYACTDPDNELKQQKRAIEGAIRFFYGSAASAFWRLYFEHVHHPLDVEPDPAGLNVSLVENGIAMSDCIASCERKDYSALDGDLRARVYNRNGVRLLIQGGVRKILCTSKGVLRTLESPILRPVGNRIATIDAVTSTNWQNEFLVQLGGDADAIGARFATIFAVDNIPEPVRALAIPSPGSPQRQLRRFGFIGGDWELYSDAYYHFAFQWLLAAE